MSDGRGSSFAQSDACTKDSKLPEGAGGAAQHGEGAPDADRDAEQRRAVNTLCNARERQADNCVEKREGEAGDGAELPVVELEI